MTAQARKRFEKRKGFPACGL